jgi:hypothetical protein
MPHALAVEPPGWWRDEHCLGKSITEMPDFDLLADLSATEDQDCSAGENNINSRVTILKDGDHASVTS